MKKVSAVKRILRVAQRECGILINTPIYLFCMIIFPIFTVFFFTSMLHSGQPQEMPVGVVDLDNTSTTRALVRRLDAFQTSRVVAHYTNLTEARQAIQKNNIYAFLYIPKGTTDDLLSSRQPKVSYYYSSVYFTAGALLMRDLKTSTLCITDEKNFEVMAQKAANGCKGSFVPLSKDDIVEIYRAAL